MKKSLFVLCAILLFASLLSREVFAAPKSGGTLKYADPLFFRNNIGWVGDPFWLIAPPASCLFFDTLVTADKMGGVQPNLATAEVANDLKSITLTLRKGVKFHDGSDWNATVAKWNIDQLINAKNGDYAYATSVDILDDYTVRINLRRYTNGILTTLGGTNMVSKAAYDAHGGGKDAVEWMRWHAVGTGPFKMVDFKPNVSIRGERFDGYWKNKPYLDAVEMYFIPDKMTMIQSFEAGEMDIMASDPTKAEYDLLRRNKEYKIEKDYIAIQCLVPDSNNPNSPLSNPKVREAIDYAIDRDAIVNNLGYGFWTTTYQFAVPGTPSYITDLPKRAYNVEKAKQLLAEAGYPDGFKTKILGSIVTTDRNAMVAVQAMLAKVGINAELSMVDHGAYSEAVRKGWDGFAAASKLIDANMNFAIDTNWANVMVHPSLKKPDEFMDLYKAAMATKEFEPAMTKKVIRYMYDNAMVNCLFAVQRSQIMQPYVRDPGFYAYSRAMIWDANKCWLDK
jgi:peptide/nickel transport system substrate-binding protein